MLNSIDIILTISFFTMGVLVSMVGMMTSLFLRWGGHTYKLASIAYGVVLILNIGYVLGVIMGVSNLGVLQANLSLISFVLLQWGTYKFFFPKKKKHLPFIMTGALALIVFISGLLASSIIMDWVSNCISLILAGLAAWWIYPQYKRVFKYMLALGSFFMASIGQLISGVLETKILLLVSLIFSAMYFVSMFLLLFERIMSVITVVSHTSITDGLTGLYLKRHFIEKTQEAINEGEAVALIFSDIDNFKKLNDTQGHQVGDEMLKFVANVMKEVCGDQGIVGRYGGEEMVALIIDPSANPAELAERFRSRVEAESHKLTSVTVSVGFSRYSEEVESASDFIREADDSMYLAKNNGKNQIREFEKKKS